MMSGSLPFPLFSRPWEALSDRERGFFVEWDYFPLPPNHTDQMRLLTPDSAEAVSRWVWSSIPKLWPERARHFRCDEHLRTDDCWNAQEKSAAVRQWLFDRGVPFRRRVYLLYEPDEVVLTTWKMVVRYWDAFGWSVGYQMVVVDHSLQWACCFHHEDLIVFGSNLDPPPARAGRRRAEA